MRGRNSYASPACAARIPQPRTPPATRTGGARRGWLSGGCGAGRGRRDRRPTDLVRHVDVRLAGGLLLLRVAAVGDVCETVAVDRDADEVEQRAVGAAADDPVRADLAVVRGRRVRDDLAERRLR